MIDTLRRAGAVGWLQAAVTLSVLGAAIALLSGCGPQFVEPGVTPTATFDLPIDYRQAYARAHAFAQRCHASRKFRVGAGHVEADLHPDTRTAVIHVNGGLIPGPEWERIRIVAQDHGSRITVSVRDRTRWARRDMGAAVQSIATGQSVCADQVSRGWRPQDSAVPLSITAAPFD